MNKRRTVVFCALCLAITVVDIAAATGFAGPTPQPSGPEAARDLAIDQALRRHPELSRLPAAASWETLDLTPTGLVGASKYQYRSIDLPCWTVTVSYAVVLHPTYTVEIQHTGEISFSWSGSVDEAGNAVELKYSVQR